MRNPLLTTSAAFAALMLVASPVGAQSQSDRARTAIAEARAKIEVFGKLGSAGELPRMQADAQAALRSAEEELQSGRERGAIDAAHRASQLADTAIGLGERNRAAQASAQQADAQATTAAAQQDAAAASERAAAAEQAAAAAQADAAAARAAPPVVVAAPTPTPTTTVTTETTRAAPARATTRSTPRRTTTRVTTRKPAASATVTERTTTTVKSN